MVTLKQLIVVLLLSILIVMFTPYAKQGMEWLLYSHDWIANALTDIFTGGQTASIIRGLIALLCIPVIIALIPSLLYWMVRRSWCPFFMDIVVIVWLIQASAIVATYKAPLA